MNNKLSYLNTVLLLTTLLFSGCKSISDNNNQDQIRILSLKGPSAITMLNMMEKTSSIDGKQIDYQIFAEPTRIRSILLQEEAEFAFLPTNMAAILYNKELPYQVVMIPVWGTLYLCGNTKYIKTIKDLNGQRVFSMARGLNPDIIFRYLLEQNGLTPDEDITIDYSFPTHIDLANAVAAGLAPLAVLSEPQMSLVLKKNPDIKILVDLNNEWKKSHVSGIPQTALIAHKSLIRDQAQLLERIIREISASCNSANNNPDKTAGLCVKYNILPDKDAALKAIPRCNILPVTGENILDPLNTYLQVFYTFNPLSIGEQLPDENFIFKK
ncbi:MAG: ABC transporter substrate-binding protein [Bacteroidales bacterium]|nr:ABC transporter substrate-binding protein [Bacteroidales bacterium]